MKGALVPLAVIAAVVVAMRMNELHDTRAQVATLETQVQSLLLGSAPIVRWGDLCERKPKEEFLIVGSYPLYLDEAGVIPVYLMQYGVTAGGGREYYVVRADTVPIRDDRSPIGLYCDTEENSCFEGQLPRWLVEHIQALERGGQQVVR